MDKFLLQNMVFFGYHGVYEYEKIHGQRFHCDVELSADFTEAVNTDELEYAIDYTKVYASIRKIMEQEKFNLIEALAGRIADELLACYPVLGVIVRIRKPACPLPGTIEFVQVEVSRGIVK